MEIVKIEFKESSKTNDYRLTIKNNAGDTIEVPIKSRYAKEIIELGAGYVYVTRPDWGYRYEFYKPSPDEHYYSYKDMKESFQAGMKYGTSQPGSESYTEFMDNLDSSK